MGGVGKGTARAGSGVTFQPSALIGIREADLGDSSEASRLDAFVREQADASPADVDTRSDIYSLGVLLYDLLVGVLPFESADLRSGGADEIRRTIREKAPPRPSTRGWSNASPN